MLKTVYFLPIKASLAGIFALLFLASTAQAEIIASLLNKKDALSKSKKEVSPALTALNEDLKEHIHESFMHVVAYCASKAYISFQQEETEWKQGLYYYNHLRNLLGRSHVTDFKEVDLTWLHEVYNEAALLEWIDSCSYKIPSSAQLKLFQEAMKTVGLDIPLLAAASDIKKRGREDFFESEIMTHITPGSIVARPAILFSSDPDKELWQAIVYHELGHLKNNDLLKAYSLGLYNGKNGITYELSSSESNDLHEALIRKYLKKGLDIVPTLASTHIGSALLKETASEDCKKALKTRGRLWSSFTSDERTTEVVYSRKLEELADLFCLETLLKNNQLNIAFRYIQEYALHLLRNSVTSAHDQQTIAYTIASEYDTYPSDTERALYGLGFLAEHVSDLSDKLIEWEQKALCQPIETTGILEADYNTYISSHPGAHDVRKAYYNPCMSLLWEKEIALNTYDKAIIERIAYLLESIDSLLSYNTNKALYYYKTLRKLLNKEDTSSSIDREWLLEVKWDKEIVVNTHSKTFIERILYLLEKIDSFSDNAQKMYYYKELRKFLGKKELNDQIDTVWLLEVKKETEYLNILKTLKATLPTPLEEKLVKDATCILGLKSTLFFIAGKTKEPVHTAGFFQIKGKNQKGILIEDHNDLDIYLMNLYTKLSILEDNTDIKIAHVFLVPDLYKGLLNSLPYQETREKMSYYFTLGLDALPTLTTTHLSSLIRAKLSLPEAVSALNNNTSSLYAPHLEDQNIDALMHITRSLEQKTILYAIENLWQQRGIDALLSVALSLALGESTDRPLVVSRERENVSATEVVLYILGFLKEHTIDLDTEILHWYSKGFCYPTYDSNPTKVLESYIQAYQQLSQGARDLRNALSKHS